MWHILIPLPTAATPAVSVATERTAPQAYTSSSLVQPNTISKESFATFTRGSRPSTKQDVMRQFEELRLSSEIKENGR